ncbi:MAG: hypothetical protein GVY25_08810 [Bacteroidetes bacterium]|nr:hypothetical protein [Bacteroidota bacterium]
MTHPGVSDTKPFVPALDFDLSMQFYTSLGWKRNWEVDGLAELELADSRILLQDFYVREWAENWMLYVVVDDARAWFEHVDSLIGKGSFGDARVQEQQEEAYGARVTYVHDPSGVLIHFAESTDQ